jgi:protein TonB
MEAPPPSAHYELKSELARVCLPATHAQAHAQRRLAWANSVCLMFLIIGVAGLRTRPPSPIKVKPLEEPIPAIIEPLPPPPANPQEQKEEDQNTRDTASEAPRVVVVTPETPAIHFAVPTIGTVIVPTALAEAPPLEPMRAPVQQAAAASKPKPKPLGNTGEGGDRPKPRQYPKMAEELGQQGAVTLLLTGDDAGTITSVQILHSSGWPILDQSAREWVQRHWILPAGAGHLFQATIDYKLEQ